MTKSEKIKLSIIIPTYNEADYLPILLNSIKKQSFTNYEVIVADNNSKDSTIKIANSYNCKVVKGGNPAEGRNNGAKYALGKYLLFLDSDVVLKEDFLENTIKKFEERKLGIATRYIAPLSKKNIDKILYTFANFFLFINQYFNPHAPGFCILVRKEIHEKINGFDETLKAAEDHDYVKRAKKYGSKFRVLSGRKISVSVRRFDSDGRWNTIKKYIYCEFYLFFRGKIKKDIYKYKFGHYKKTRKNLNKVKE